MADLPPTQKGRHHEVRAQALREFAGLRFDHQRLDPFSLARYANLLVASFDEIAPHLSEEARRHLTDRAKHLWSGGAASHALPGGEKLIILNPTHHRNRQNATLMEEICHVFLGHQPSRLSVETRNKHGEVIARDYNHAIEEEAYSTGAAALVPYTAVKRMVAEGMTSQQIARHFAVSRPLVEYRIKVSRLWGEYRSKQGLTGRDGV